MKIPDILTTAAEGSIPKMSEELKQFLGVHQMFRTHETSLTKDSFLQYSNDTKPL